jgi:hypothetical protein
MMRKYHLTIVRKISARTSEEAAKPLMSPKVRKRTLRAVFWNSRRS